MIFFNNISSVKVLNLFIIAVLCFNSLYIILDNLEFDAIEIVDGFDKESKSENEVDEKIEFENEIIKEFNKSEKAVFSFNGKMIDKPILRIMENRLKALGIK